MAFWNRKTKEKLAALPVVNATMELNQTLKLARIRLTYDVDSRSPYRAYVNYSERPKDWNDNGATKQVEIKAKSWTELIDKAAAHFEENKGV